MEKKMHNCKDHENLTCNQGVRKADLPGQDSQYPQGIKWTKQRKDVYEVLLQATEPLSAVQIYNLIEKTDNAGNYAISTIYRILTAFEEKNIVSKTSWMGDGTFVYELNKGQHTHYAVCMSCHKRIALHACPFEQIRLNACEDEHGLEQDGFVVTGHKLELYGYCKQCRG